MSSAEIAKAINLRDRPMAPPIGRKAVDDMLKNAKSPSVQEKYTATCGYKKWAGVKERLAARKGVRDPDDGAMEEAHLIFDVTWETLEMM